MAKIINHPTSIVAKQDRLHDRENLARQLRTTQMMREAAREQINPTEIIDSIMGIDLLLQGSKDPAGNPIPLEKEVIAALRARASIKFNLLGKVLPDLKATESITHNTHDHTGVIGHVAVSNIELAQRLQLWRKQHDVEEKDESCVEATFTEVKDEYEFL